LPGQLGRPGEVLPGHRDEAAAGRPAPYMIHRVMEATGGHDVRNVVAGGDTVVDLLAAHHAGVSGLGVLTGALGREELEQHPHSWVLDGVKDLPGVLESAPVNQ
jgi:phosphoglycolate phosphatase